MRKLLLAVAVVGLMGSMIAPASAGHQRNHTETVTFTAGTPCAFACPYWLDDGNTDIDGNGDEDIAFATCENPSGGADMLDGVGLPYQEGTVYDDIRTRAAPSGTNLIVFKIFPPVDFDSFICEDSSRKTELAQGANILGENCDNFLGPNNPVPAGCEEEASIPVSPGERVILRVYNWSDGATTQGEYTFIRV